MNTLKNDMDLLTSIKGVGEYRASLIIAYCGSAYEAIKKNSLLNRGHVPAIGLKLSKYIIEQVKNKQNDKNSN